MRAQQTHRLRVLPPSSGAVTRPGVRRRVALVSMPFQAAELPSIALGTLAEVLRERGHEVDVLPLNLDFAVRVGFGRYEEICSYAAWLRLYGEWLFADEHVAPGAASLEGYHAFLREHRWRDRARHLESYDPRGLRAEADRAVLRWFSSRDWSRYDVVGFNVMFQQLNASLRLGRMIKRAHPPVRIILGGSAVEVPMGQPVLERHPWLDAIFSGYAERTLPEYVEGLPERVERVITQAAQVGMDELPVPSFDEFFAEVRRMGAEGAADFSVPIETSRGCWWGERQHCIFCGLNALDMKQRDKSADRVVREIVRQRKYGRPFFATDNILPREAFQGLFDRLIAEGVPFDTFYETKANLTLAELRTLRRAGISCIQPGIESLSTPILKEMKKGVRAAQNLWLLRAADELGLGIAWSILYGFPQEDPAEYERITALLPSLCHLPPPLRPAPVLLERYSPLFDHAADYGLRDVRPTLAHRMAFGDAPELAERAYVFDFEYGDGRQPDTYTGALNRDVAAWIEARRRPLSPRCEVFCFGDLEIVLDTRAEDAVGHAWPRIHVLSAAERALVALTEEITSDSALESAWDRQEPLRPILEAFLRRRWLLRVDGRLVRILLRRDQPYVRAELSRAARGGFRRASRALHRARAYALDRLRALRRPVTAS